MSRSPHLSPRAAFWHLLILLIAIANLIAWIYYAAPASVR